MNAISILAVSLSLASTNDYVYTKPQNIEIAGSAAFGSDGLVRGEDVAFALEAAKERRAALTYVSTNEEYDASAILASKLNEVQDIKSRLTNQVEFSQFVDASARLPDAVFLNGIDDFKSFVDAIGHVAMSNVSGVAVSSGSPLSKSAVAALPSGFDNLKRVVFRSIGETGYGGYTYSNTKVYFGDPPDIMDEYTGEFFTGEFPEPESYGGNVPGISGELGSWSRSIEGSKTKARSWRAVWEGEHLKWESVANSSTGPAYTEIESKYSVRTGAQVFCPGNALRDSAKGANVLGIYAICSYKHTKDDLILFDARVAVRLDSSASLDYGYAEYHAGYLPRILISAYSADALSDKVVNAFGETKITTVKVQDPATPYAPEISPSRPDQIEYTGNSEFYGESQQVNALGFFVVLDFDFNAKTL